MWSGDFLTLLSLPHLNTIKQSHLPDLNVF